MAMQTERYDACLCFLERALVLIRVYCQNQETNRAEAIADAVHMLPKLLRGRVDDHALTEFWEMYLKPLVVDYPEMRELVDRFPKPAESD
jgi:hypothetical protein